MGLKPVLGNPLGGVVDALDTSTGLSLDQTTPQTIINGVPLMTTTVSDTGSNTQLVNKEYVDKKVNPVFTFFV